MPTGSRFIIVGIGFIGWVKVRCQNNRGDARQHNDERHDHFQKGGKYQPFLCLSGALGGDLTPG